MFSVGDVLFSEESQAHLMNQFLCQLHHVVVITVCLVKLQHGEFWIVLGRDSLIPEIPVNLVDFLKAPDN